MITINQEDYNLAKTKLKAKQTYITNGTGVDSQKFREIEKEQKEKIKANLNIQKDDFIILSIGELNKNKNHIMQIKAISELNNKKIKLFVLGNGPLKEFYEEQIKHYQLQEQVKILGYKKEINDYLKISDIVVSTSIREGLGINIIEAMLNKKPVIATQNRGHRQLIEDGVTGYLVPTDNVEYLKQKIIEIMDDKEKQKEFSEKAYINIQAYKVENVKKQLEIIYDNL